MERRFKDTRTPRASQGHANGQAFASLLVRKSRGKRRRMDPKQKKAESLKHDRRNIYGENDKT